MITVRKTFWWSLTPTTQQPFIWQVDTTLEPASAGVKTRRSTQALDQYGNVTTAEEYDYGPAGSGPNTATKKVFSMTYLDDVNYTSRYIRNRMKVLSRTISGTTTTLATNYYDSGLSVVTSPCTGWSIAYNPLPFVTLHDTTNYGQSFAYRGNLTTTTFPGGSSCRSFDFLGAVRDTWGNSGSTTLTPDPNRQYAVPSLITANGYNTSLQWDGLLQLTNATGPNNASSTFGWDLAGRPKTQTAPDGEVTTFDYSVASRTTTAKSGNRMVVTYMDGLGRPVRVETGSKPSSTFIVDSVVETEYAPCACTPMGKMWRVSQPHRPTDPAVWTTYTYDELGRVKTVTHPPNTGTAGNSGVTTYNYAVNTVTVTDPAGRWKKFTMDGFGNLTTVEEPKPAGGTYVTNYTYTPTNKLKTVSMTRDGYSGTTPLAAVTQTRTFTYGADDRLASTTFADVPGTTSYGYYADGRLLYKLSYKGVWKYDYDAAKRLTRISRYPGATSYGTATNESLPGRVSYYYDSHPFTTDFVVENGSGRLAAIEYDTNMREFYSYTRGGKLKKKRMERVGQAWKLEVSFEYDIEGKLQFMVYPSGKRVKYTYDDLARQTGMKEVVGLQETDVVNGVTYGAAGELRSMSWLAITGQPFASQTWAYNNRLQMTQYTYTAQGTQQINHQYQYNASANDGKLWRRKDVLTSWQEVEYQYNSIHRLTSASVVQGTGQAGQEWGQSYVYDGFGNMVQKIGYGLASGTSTGAATGSSLSNGAQSVGDIDSRILQSGSESYLYAPDNKRVQKIFPVGGMSTRHVYLWVGNMRVGTYQIAWDAGTSQHYVIPVKDDLYIAGRRVAPSDRLGSDLSGGIKLLPYGEELQPPNVANNRTKFATYHRDDTGIDYADQRYYLPGTGRFRSADPFQGSAQQTNPTSWNRYFYANADPLNLYDPSGLNPEGPPADPKSYCEIYPYACIGGGGTGGSSPTSPGEKRKIDNIARIREEALAYADAVRRGVYTDCEGLANFATWVSQEVESSMFTAAFTVLYPAAYGGHERPVYFTPPAPKPGAAPGSTSGYKSQFVDAADPNGDQAHHFGFFFVKGAGFAHLGPEEAAFALTGMAVGLEVLNAFRDHTFNVPDVNLGIAAGMMGHFTSRSMQGLSSPLSAADIGSIIRKELCK